MAPESPHPFAATAASTWEDLRVPAAEGRLFAVLDACDEPRIPGWAYLRGERARCLYRGGAEEKLWALAPYLFAADGDLLSEIRGALANDPWGILIESAASFEDVWTHLRRFLVRRAPDGTEVYFRFYDPRVLPDYLATAPPDEAALFFGKSTAFHAPVDAAAFTRTSPGPDASKIVPASAGAARAVSASQWEALAAARRRAFLRRTEEALRRDHGDALGDLDGDALTAFVALHAARAETYGLRTEAAVARFTALCLRYEDLASDPPAEDLARELRHPSRNALQRLDAVEERLVFGGPEEEESDGAA